MNQKLRGHIKGLVLYGAFVFTAYYWSGSYAYKTDRKQYFATLISVVISSFAYYWISIGVAIYHNYRLCQTAKLPIVISPTASLNPFWIIAYQICPPLLKLLPLLPFNLGAWVRYTYLGWQFDDGHKAHDKYGPAFIVCTPSINEVYIADPSAAQAVLSARKAFIKPAVMYDGLNVFGKNVNSVEGETWQRHRKITAPNLNERISGSVWREGVRQAGELVKSWVEKGSEGTTETREDAAAVTLNVFMYAGFGMQHPFREQQGHVPSGHAMSYREALHLVLKNFTLLVMLPMAALKWRIWPKNMQKVGQACDEYKLYLKEMVEHEKVFSDATPREAGNLLTSLVQANQAETGKNALSDDELFGNLFIYNFAGHETVANAVESSITFLASKPAVQDWLNEEIAEVTGHSSPVTWNYATIFPRLKRCQAVMYETLRLHGSVVFIPKAATEPSQTVVVNGTPHVIPAHTFVTLNLQALHTDKATWGEDSSTWRPDRWIDATRTNGVGREELIEPVPGSFVPFADGPRACAGTKFAQVEFTAVLATLFKDHVVRPRLLPGEMHEGAVGRIDAMIKNSMITAITVQMRDPKAVSLVWAERP